MTTEHHANITQKTTEDRKTILLKAAFDILKKCNDGIYVKNALAETAFYDDAECDGYCLMTDIADELGLDEEFD